ncbi:hypothetical protein RBU49_15875 [Clostridium sp. MB40-C1]|uniref:hypothetical protein n=1 Tax=Clostridium sp. MB40-C1 TaxID=3070996 RepID=UPI0027DEB3A9|nr:hypothetical protein [Clostridium sp. MB40-C1]WMJ80274.1 hypothetical protein RBU49_15875 [Clostridium sp. MB40-C1]
MNKNSRVIYATTELEKSYNNNSLWGKIKDKLYTKHEEDYLIKELGITVSKVKFPPNFHENAFERNVHKINKKFGSNNSSLALKTIRKLDYYFYSEFQKKLFAYSVVKSIQLILMTRQKSISNSCILVFDGADEINRYIVFELAKKSKFFILLSNNIRKTRELCDCIISSFGSSPVVTNDMDFALKSADFIITSRPLNSINKSPIWYLDNTYVPKEYSELIVNDVSYSTPWQVEKLSLTPELLGAIFANNKIDDIEEFLGENKIFIKNIGFESAKFLP